MFKRFLTFIADKFAAVVVFCFSMIDKTARVTEYFLALVACVSFRHMLQEVVFVAGKVRELLVTLITCIWFRIVVDCFMMDVEVLLGGK